MVRTMVEGEKSGERTMFGSDGWKEALIMPEVILKGIGELHLSFTRARRKKDVEGKLNIEMRMKL